MERIKVFFPGLVPGKGPLDVVELARALQLAGYKGAYWMAGPEEHKFAELNARASEIFEVVSADEAQVWIYPYRAAGDLDICRAIACEAESHGAECIFFSWGDVDAPIDVPYGRVYRHSLFSDKRLSCEAAMPGFTTDVLQETGRSIETRPWRPMPVVGFCGYVSTPLMRTVHRLTGRTRKTIGLELRNRLLRQLNQSEIKTNFICRNGYWAGTVSRFHRDTAGQFGPRKEFLNNVFESDYTLCVRGAGNFSYRFYEVLSAGRIPLFINTRCVLPFDHQIHWRDHCVWVEESEIDRADEILLRFHREISPEKFEQMQRANRKLWEQYLAPLEFYRRVISVGTAPSTS